MEERRLGEEWGGMERITCIIHSHCTNYSVHDMYRFHVTAVWN